MKRNVPHALTGKAAGSLQDLSAARFIQSKLTQEISPV